MHASVHTAATHACAEAKGGQSSLASLVVSDAHSAFHVYALDWNTDTLTFYADGTIVHSFGRRLSTPDEKGLVAPSWMAWPFDTEFYLVINLAVGGNWAGKHGVDDAAFPATFDIAYVRVYEEVL